jgi:Polysaccharide lyase
VSGVAFAACRDEKASPGSPTSPAALPPLPTAAVLWSADHETGDLSQWYAGDGGGEFNSGAAASAVTTEVAHSGRYSARTTIRTPGTSAVRLFRWNESRATLEAYYSAWFYFPRRYRVPDWWNVFQFKSRNGAANDPFWSVQVGNRRSGAMYLYLNWWDGLTIEGPHRGEFGGRSFDQGVRDIPEGTWIHIQVFLRQSAAFDGQVIVWQDGIELFNVRDVRTRYPDANGANEWSVNNYADAVTPSPTTIYIDDAVISTSRIGL